MFDQLHPDRKSALQAFNRLLDIMDDLREKCPWDRAQNFQSLRTLTIEEVYELAEAILDEDMDGICEEVGDLMLHLAFYAKLGEERNGFTMAEALERECEKLVRRHPHIYGDVDVADEEEVKANWEKIKKTEGKSSVLSGVPKSLPAMVKALRMQEKTGQVGFEWEEEGQAWEKVTEEMQEFRDALSRKASREEVEDEFGDILFSLVNVARYWKIDPESALERVNRKFKKRFEYIEQAAGERLQEMSLEEMDALWEESKSR